MRFTFKPQVDKIKSPYRQGMELAVVEGIWAMLLLTMLSGPFLTAYLLYLGANSQQIGLVLAVPAIANLLQILSAMYMQKLKNRKRAFVLFASAHRLIGLMTGLIPFIFPKEIWLTVFIVIFLLYSSINAFAGVIWTSLISDMVPGQLRGKYFGIRNVITSAVNSIGLYITGVIIDRYEGALGFNIMFILAAITVIMNIIYFARYPNPEFEKPREMKVGTFVLRPFKDRVFFKGLLFLSIWTFIITMTHPFFSYVMLDVLGVRYQTVANLVILQTVSSMCGFYICGQLSRKFSERTLLLSSLPFLAVAALLWGTLSFLPELLVLILIFLCLGFGLGSYNQQIFIFMIGSSPKAERPIYIAVFSAITGLAGFFGPTIGGTIFEELKRFPLWIQQYGFFLMLGIVLLVLGTVVAPLAFHKQK
ncbi:MFS transporter [Paenibacillus endoradicis]|uniref:MFS transporter n=1 Tax=Paenibacillus endoradicis TaxID=2972487 RepID=UPI002158BA9D|nr:MFS transporter [Paenibacillus endoradicis]MCR8659657.1 MFS transporter [Paenibacillus endoradicis]